MKKTEYELLRKVVADRVEEEFEKIADAVVKSLTELEHGFGGNRIRDELLRDLQNGIIKRIVDRFVVENYDVIVSKMDMDLIVRMAQLKAAGRTVSNERGDQ